MSQPQRTRYRLPAAVLAACLLAGCIVRDSPAPGCVERIGPGMMGGCQGRTAILDVVLTPEQSCLSIRANNCNGGVLEIANDCGDPLELGGLTILPGERETADVVSAADGAYELAGVAGNFAATIPDADLYVTLEGDLGGLPLTLTFTKTGPLCGE